MNFYVPVEDGRLHTIVTVVATAEDPATAQVLAVTHVTELQRLAGRTFPGERLSAGPAVPTPPNAYAIVVAKDGTHELVLGYTAIETRTVHSNVSEEVLPTNVIAVHLDEPAVPDTSAAGAIKDIFRDAHKRTHVTSYAGEPALASLPVVTVSERVIARLLSLLKVK